MTDKERLQYVIDLIKGESFEEGYHEGWRSTIKDLWLLHEQGGHFTEEQILVEPLSRLEIEKCYQKLIKSIHETQ